MKIVLFSRVPRWYSFKNERLARRLAAEGHEIAGVVVEQTKTLDSIQEWRRKLGVSVFAQKATKKIFNRNGHSQTNGSANLPEIDPPVFFVRKHNSPECETILRRLQPDVLVLRGCGILKKNILNIPRIGAINPHYAVLPDFRGMDVTEWSVLHDAPVAVSIHAVGEGVDTGAVILSGEIEITTGDTTGSLRDKCAALAVDLIAEALRNIEKTEELPGESKNGASGKQFFQMHERLRELANRKIAAKFTSKLNGNAQND
jgi:methionyl-tRNA formyltransferase